MTFNIEGVEIMVKLHFLPKQCIVLTLTTKPQKLSVRECGKSVNTLIS